MQTLETVINLREKLMKNSSFKLYNEGYVGNVLGYEVFVGGAIDTRFAKERANVGFIYKGLEKCEEEKEKLGGPDKRGENYGVVTIWSFFPKTVEYVWGRKKRWKQEYQFIVNQEKMELCFMFKEDI